MPHNASKRLRRARELADGRVPVSKDPTHRPLSNASIRGALTFAQARFAVSLRNLSLKVYLQVYYDERQIYGCSVLSRTNLSYPSLRSTPVNS